MEVSGQLHFQADLSPVSIG